MGNGKMPVKSPQTALLFSPRVQDGNNMEKPLPGQERKGPSGKAGGVRQALASGKAASESGKGLGDMERPGLLLVQDTIRVGLFGGDKVVYLYVVIDTFSSFAFGFLHVGIAPEAAVGILHAEVFPFYREKGIPVAAVQTDGGEEFCGHDMHIYRLYLALRGVEHYQVTRMLDNCFIRYFRREMAILFADKLGQRSIDSIEKLKEDFAVWLNHYNYQKPNAKRKLAGKQNMSGKSPVIAIEAYIAAMLE